MTNLIDERYFKSGINYLPSLQVNKGFDDSIEAEEIENLRKAISYHQSRFFLYALGRELYNEFAEDPAAEKWEKMLSRLIDAENFVSPLANFVYCHYIEENESRMTPVGVVKTTLDNSANLPVSYKQVPSWNQMCDMMDEFFIWLYDNQAMLADENELSTRYWSRLNTTINIYGI